MQKITSWGVPLAIAALVLSGCGGSVDKTAATHTTGTPSSTSFVWPADSAVTDSNAYAEGNDPDALTGDPAYKNGPNGAAGATNAQVAAANLPLSSVNETPAQKHLTMTVNGQTFGYMARAGHLIAAAPPASSTGSASAEASIFYMSYTRDDIPHDQRPITFVFNGGPGEPSIWLHLGSWAPQRLDLNAPAVPPGPYAQDSYPLIPNAESMLDQTDLVYVDIPGSGFSEAIAPLTNLDLWNTNMDAQVFRDFITAYINRYNRQSSPKYLYGESYSGIRTPIVANLLEQAGTSHYVTDPTGKPPVVLTGYVLQSPVMNYATNQNVNTVGIFPTEGMVSSWYGLGSARGNLSEADYSNTLRNFTTTQFISQIGNPNPPAQYLTDLQGITGIPLATLTKNSQFNSLSQYNSYYSLIGLSIYPSSLQPSSGLSNSAFDAYDGRISTASPQKYGISNYEDAAFYGAIKPLIQSETGYQPADPTQLYGSDIAANYWVHNHNGALSDTSVPDLVEAMTIDPKLKVLVLHGYHDNVCPFFQTELDLQNGGALPALASRITIGDFDGGHMIYLTNSSRAPMRAQLRTFYSSPTAAVQTAAAR